MEQIRILVPIEPRPMPRPRFSRGRVYAPKEIVEYKSAIRAAAVTAMKGREPLTGDLSCVVKFYRKFKASSRRFGDGDNLFKAITDALNGVAYFDDAQITRATIEKYQSAFPKVEVEIRSVEQC